MSIRREYLSAHFRSYLDRRAMPRTLDGKPKAQSEELEALIDCLCRYAPKERYDDWWPRMVIALDEESATRAWPSVGEISKAGRKVRGPDLKVVSEGYELDPLVVAANRMNSGLPVGDGFAYGRLAVDLLRGGHVTMDVLRKYRSAIYFRFKDVYGVDVAKKMEAELIQRHELAEKLNDTVRRERDAAIPEPKRPQTYEWDGAP